MSLGLQSFLLHFQFIDYEEKIRARANYLPICESVESAQNLELSVDAASVA